MLDDSASTDRRSALKARHRQAIVGAAMTLMEHTGGIDFTVDELAREADVARRTVFNHFDTVDDIVVAACGELLSTIIEPLESPAAEPHDVDRSMFDEVADALRHPDLVPAMVRVGRMLGSDRTDVPSPRQALLFVRTVTELSERAAAALARRHPDADELSVELLVSAFMSGAITVHRHWVAETGWRDDTTSRRFWAELVEHLIDTTRAGHVVVGGSYSTDT